MSDGMPIVEFEAPPSVTEEIKDPGVGTRRELKLVARSVAASDMFMRVSLLPLPKSQASWFSFPPALSRFLVKAGSDPFPIPVSVDIPGGTPFGEYGFKVLVANDANTEREYSTSEPVLVRRGLKVVTPWKWWPYVAGGIAAAAIATVVILLLMKPSLGDKCEPARPKCPASARCPAEKSTCLAPNRLACKKNEHCLSNKCVDGACVAAVLGEACFPSESACEGPQADGRVGPAPCHPATSKCAGNPGGPCRTVADCILGACTRDGAKTVCGARLGQKGCDLRQSADQCPDTQQCVSDSGDGRTQCLLKAGQLCPTQAAGGATICSSQRCNNDALCAPGDGTCTVPSDCVPGSQCTPQPGGTKKCISAGGVVTKPDIHLRAIRDEFILKHVEVMRGFEVKRPPQR
jgi:hypothetical protein